MPTELYLTPVLKQYYMLGLQTIAVLPEDSIYKLDTDILPYLNEINTNEQLQTLLSKKLQGIQFGGENNSSLLLAYTAGIERSLAKALEDFTLPIDFFLHEPGDNIFYDATFVGNIPIKTNKDYFRIKHYFIEFRSGKGLVEHEAFWVQISSLLKKI